MGLLFLALNGFSLTPSLVPPDSILAGGPPKDGIPALTDPRVEPAALADTWLHADDRILGVVVNGRARAYPVRILNWHEIVNDRIGDHPFVVTYCPLCGSGMAFDTRDRFGVSGLLYQSDVLLYDKKTESLWSQLMLEAIAGPRMGERLKPMPLIHTSWAAWRRLHPQTTVLSRKTGYARDYNRNPYAGYEQSRSLYFPVHYRDNRLHPKTWVIGIDLEGAARAWPLAAIRKAGEIRENWNHHRLLVRDRDGLIEILDAESGKKINTVVLYWFAWVAFHPGTSLYGASD